MKLFQNMMLYVQLAVSATLGSIVDRVKNSARNVASYLSTVVGRIRSEPMPMPAAWGPQAQKGLTLVELMVGLLIALAIIAIAIVAFNATRSSQRTTGMQSQLLQVVAAVQKVAPGPNYNGVTEATVIQAGHAPSNMVNGTTLVNSFGGSVTIAAATYGGGTGAADNAFVTTFNGVPRSECNAVLASAHPTFTRILVGTTAVKDQYGASPIQYSTATATAACDNDANSIAFTYSS